MNARLDRAVTALLDLDPAIWLDHATSFTCVEIEAIADLFRAIGDYDLAQDIIDEHAFGDDEGDQHWRGEG